MLEWRLNPKVSKSKTAIAKNGIRRIHKRAEIREVSNHDKYGETGIKQAWWKESGLLYTSEGLGVL